MTHWIAVLLVVGVPSTTIPAKDYGACQATARQLQRGLVVTGHAGGAVWECRPEPPKKAGG